MKIIQYELNEREKWDSFVAREPSFGLLQSWSWGEFKEKLGWKAFRIAVENHGDVIAGAQMLIKDLPLGAISAAYIPRGPVGNWLDEEITMQLFSQIHEIARHHRAVFLRIEPAVETSPIINQTLCQYHFQAVRNTNQPRATIIVNIEPDLDQILGQMHQKTRYNIRYAERKGVVVRQGSRDDLPILEHFLHILGSEAKFAPRKLEYFQKEWDTFDPLGEFKIFIASHEKTVLAIHAHAKFGQHAAYFHGASSGEMKQLMPNYMLMWEAIKWAKSENCRTFDLWGIPDEVGLASYQNNNLSTTERTDGLWGVYRFKRGFSTNVILYSSAHDYIYNPLLYRFVNNRFINSSLLERVAVWMDNMRGG